MLMKKKFTTYSKTCSLSETLYLGRGASVSGLLIGLWLACHLDTCVLLLELPLTTAVLHIRDIKWSI